MAENPRMGTGTAARGADPYTGVRAMAVEALPVNGRGLLLTTASTGLGVVMADGSAATLTALPVGVLLPLAVKQITALGGGAGWVLL